MNRDIIILREAVTKVVQMLAGMGLKVTQRGSEAWVRTNIKTLKPEWVNIPYIPDNATDELICAIQGFMDHEVAHILFTDWNVVVKATAHGAKMRDIHNVVEDTFIERKMGQRFPGAGHNLSVLHDFFTRKITQPALDEIEKQIADGCIPPEKANMHRFGVLLVPLCRAWSGQHVFDRFLRDNGHYENPLIKSLMTKIQSATLARFPKLKDSWECYTVAEEILAIINPPKKPKPAPAHEPEPDQENTGGDSDDQGEASDKKDGKGKGEKNHKEDSKNADGDENSGEAPEDANNESGKGEGETGDDAGGTKPGEDSQEAEEKNEKSKKPKKGTTDDDENVDKGDADDGEDQDSGSDGPGEDADGGDGSVGDEPDEPDDADCESSESPDGEPEDEDAGDQPADAGVGDGAPDDDTQDEDGPSDEGPDDGDLENSESESGSGDEDFESGDDAEEEAEEAEEDGGGSGDEKDKDGADGDVYEGAGGDEKDKDGADGDVYEGAGGDPQGGSVTDIDDAVKPKAKKGAGKKPAPKEPNIGFTGGDFDDEDIEIDSKTFAEQIVKHVTDEAVRQTKGADYSIYSNEFDIMGKHTMTPYYKDEQFTKLDEQTRAMVGTMQKDIERMMAQRDRVQNVGGYRSGRLHSSGLHRLLNNDDRVFRRKLETRAKDTAVVLLVDQSGSMKGNALLTAMTAAYALSSTLERVNITHEVMTFTTSYHGKPGSGFDYEDIERKGRALGINYSRIIALRHTMVKEFQERLTPPVRHRFADLAVNQPFCEANCDGEAVQMALTRLMQRREQRKVLLVLSDGFPAAGDDAAMYSHLHKMVADGEKAGIEIIGIGIASEAVKTFYPKNMVLNNIADLPKLVMGELRRILAA